MSQVNQGYFTLPCISQKVSPRPRSLFPFRNLSVYPLHPILPWLFYTVSLIPQAITGQRSWTLKKKGRTSPPPHHLQVIHPLPPFPLPLASLPSPIIFLSPFSPTFYPSALTSKYLRLPASHYLSYPCPYSLSLVFFSYTLHSVTRSSLKCTSTFLHPPFSLPLSLPLFILLPHIPCLILPLFSPAILLVIPIHS